MTTARISWGTKITFLYLGFVLLIVTLVWKSMNQDFDLVSKDYYNEELAYQQVINAGKNQALLSAPVIIQQDNGRIVFDFPAEFEKVTLKANVHFYCRATTKWDKTYDFEIVDGQYSIAATGLQPTYYVVKLKWEHNGKQYYQETPIKVNT
jgi:hypothetical protein